MVSRPINRNSQSSIFKRGRGLVELIVEVLMSIKTRSGSYLVVKGWIRQLIHVSQLVQIQSDRTAMFPIPEGNRWFTFPRYPYMWRWLRSVVWFQVGFVSKYNWVLSESGLSSGIKFCWQSETGNTLPRSTTFRRKWVCRGGLGIFVVTKLESIDFDLSHPVGLIVWVSRSEEFSCLMARGSLKDVLKTKTLSYIVINLENVAITP